jgi:hypothetical protein
MLLPAAAVILIRSPVSHTNNLFRLAGGGR